MDATEFIGGITLQIKHLCPFHELHAKRHTGAFQGTHQLPAVVDLTVLFEQQPGNPFRSQAWDFPFQAAAVQGLPELGCRVGVPIGGCSERHHDAAGAQPAAQAAVTLDLRHCHPAGKSSKLACQVEQASALRHGAPAAPATNPAASLRRRLITVTVSPRRASWCAIARPIKPPPSTRVAGVCAGVIGHRPPDGAGLRLLRTARPS